MIQLNCGCEAQDYNDTVDICLKEWNIVFGGEIPCIGHYTVCKACYNNSYYGREDLIVSDEEGQKWLS